MTREPIRTCVGCRTRFEQARLVRFVRDGGAWRCDDGRPRSRGRGAYLCSERCAVRVSKNKRYAGLAATATAVAPGRWRLPADARAMYDRPLDVGAMSMK